jgi:hypothetical protein
MQYFSVSKVSETLVRTCTLWDSMDVDTITTDTSDTTISKWCYINSHRECILASIPFPHQLWRRLAQESAEAAEFIRDEDGHKSYENSAVCSSEERQRIVEERKYLGTCSWNHLLISLCVLIHFHRYSRDGDQIWRVEFIDLRCFFWCSALWGFDWTFLLSELPRSLIPAIAHGTVRLFCVWFVLSPSRYEYIVGRGELLGRSNRVKVRFESELEVVKMLLFYTKHLISHDCLLSLNLRCLYHTELTCCNISH